MKEIRISSGRIGGKSALLHGKGSVAWATRKIVTDCDEIIEALRDYEVPKSGARESESHKNPSVFARNGATSTPSLQA